MKEEIIYPFEVQDLQNPDIDIIIDKIEEADYVAFDIETTGLNIRKDKIIGFGIAWSETESAYFYTYNEEQYEVARNFLNKFYNFSPRILAFNSYFDLEFTKNYFKVDLWNNLHTDVLVLKHTLDEDQPFGLKEIAKKLYGTDATKEKEELKASIKANGGSTNEFYKADPLIMAKYCKQDCMLTYRIFRHYYGMLESEGLSEFFYKDEVMPLYKEVTRFMMSRGVKVDVPALEKAKAEIEQDIAKLSDEIMIEIKPQLDEFYAWSLNKSYPMKKSGVFAEAAAKLSGLQFNKTSSGGISLSKPNLAKMDQGSKIVRFFQGRYELKPHELKQIQREAWHLDGRPEQFNLASKHHLKKLFFDIFEEKPVSRTDKGSPQVDDQFLEAMAEKYQWVHTLQNLNKLNKLNGAYITRLLDSQEDGIFYPSFFQHRTISGRYGSDLQQLPRPSDGEFDPIVEKYRNQIRSFFISRSDNCFLDADYESLEPHIFAHVSGEDKIKDIFLKGHDFYSTIAILVEKLEGVTADKSCPKYLGNVNKQKRQFSKAYSLGIPYGMEAYALSKTLGIDQNEAEFLIRAYLESFDNLQEWMTISNESVKLKGYVLSEAGRKRRFPLAQRILKRYGTDILNSLQLWKDYGHNRALYESMKIKRKIVKNALNNAKNFQIQSLAASIVNRATIAINRRFAAEGISGGVVAQIHDQIICEVPEKFKEKAVEIMRDCMENTYKISIPLKAPVETGHNFKETH